MSRLMWIAVICGVAFVGYTWWQRSQLTPRVPVTGSGGGSSSSGGGLLDGLTNTVDKLKGLFHSIGGGLDGDAPSSSRGAPSSSEVTWI